jgi:hypothetical protein
LKALSPPIFPFGIFGGIDIAFIFGEHHSFPFPFFQESFSSTWSNTPSREYCKAESWRDIALDPIFNCAACLTAGIPWRKILRSRLDAGLREEPLLSEPK